MNRTLLDRLGSRCFGRDGTKELRRRVIENIRELYIQSGFPETLETLGYIMSDSGSFTANLLGNYERIKNPEGIGEFDLLENYTAMFGKKAFYTIDGFLYDDLKTRLDKSYETSGSDFRAVKFGGECSYSEVDRIIREFQEFEADVLVGVGGGKTLDTAQSAADKTGVALAELSFEILMEQGISALHALKQGVCTEAVENVIEANTLLSGVGFENTSCAAAHGIHAGLTQIPSTHKYLHGEKVAFGVVCQMVMENTPKETVEKVMHFCNEVGLPTTLEELDVEATHENVMVIAEIVVNNKLIYAEPFKITLDFVYNSIVAADAMGHYYKEKFS